MINLLPPEEKEARHLENDKKVAIILGVIVLVWGLCLVLMLASLHFYILGEINSKNFVLEQAKLQYQTPSFLSFKDIIQKNNAVLTTLDSFYKKELDFSQVLQIISDLERPQGLSLTNLSVQKQDNQSVKVTASGFSPSRDDLLAFQKSIQKDARIKNSYFSPESWIDPQNVTFYLPFEIPKQK